MNIANLLKYCPKGTKLYSTIFGDLEFLEIDSENRNYPITVTVKDKDLGKEKFTAEGKWTITKNSECVLFPSKDNRDWNKFRIPVKKGDIIMIPNTDHAFITTGEFTDNASVMFICGVDEDNELCINPGNAGWTKDFYIPSSSEAKKKLFDKMAEAGYRWNDKTLELEKIELKFKEGDVAVDEAGNLYLVRCQNETYTQFYCMLYVKYNSLAINTITAFPKEHFFRLANNEETEHLKRVLKSKFYILDTVNHWLVKNELKPFDKVLIRDDINEKWSINLFSYYDEEDEDFPYICQNGGYHYCIPYEGNEHLLGTNNPE